MGCIRLDIIEKSFVPMKVVYRKSDFEQKSVQRFMSVDPLAHMYPGMSPYNYVGNNPIKHTDPTGRSIDGEFEKDKDGNWQKTSTKGDDIGVDFYHHEASDSKPQQTYVTDRKGNWNVITNGKNALQGEVRSSDVNYETITDEFLNGTGPERSFFEGDHPANSAIDKHYLFNKELTLFELGSYGSKHRSSIEWSPLDVVKTRSNNMQAQMMGSYTASFYKLGDKTLSLVQDSKSRYSLLYHLPGVQNYSRSEGNPVYNSMGIEMGRSKANTNTYQTYLFFGK